MLFRSGTVNVAGINSLLESNSSLYVGSYGTGTLNISDGAQAKANGTTGGVRIGYNAGSTGTVAVAGTNSGINSLLESDSSLSVGNSGTGTLSISGGAQAKAKANGSTGANQGVLIGYNAGSTGTVTVDGTNSLLESDGVITVGNSGTGTLSISDGAQAKTNGTTGSSHGVRIGNGAGGTGTVTVDGVGSLLESAAQIYVGNVGTGKLFVDNGGVVSSTGTGTTNGSIDRKSVV